MKGDINIFDSAIEQVDARINDFNRDDIDCDIMKNGNEIMADLMNIKVALRGISYKIQFNHSMLDMEIDMILHKNQSEIIQKLDNLSKFHDKMSKKLSKKLDQK
ncbi:MAG: hypothetical protein LBU51_03080 [Bacteroidales bacterium]|nr:hypothetical protein [Bacteroidales bacterium]